MSEGRRWPFGKHRDAGRTIDEVVLCYPDYIHWWNNNPHSSGFQWLDDYIAAAIDVFDRRLFTNAKCAGKVDGIPCTRPVTLATLYKGSCSPAFWCDECDPLQLGASSATLTEVTTYNQAAAHARCCDRARTSQRSIIKEFAIAKGLTKPWTKEKMFQFLHERQEE